MSGSRAKGNAGLTPQDRLRYFLYFTCAILMGLVSLFSYGILAVITNGNAMALYQLAPIGVVGAIACFVVAMLFKTKAGRVRENSYYLQSAKSKE
jgi:uncharacterized membrane protein YuzA (DUF378 family)